MTIRPTDRWRKRIETEAQQIAAGELAASEAYYAARYGDAVTPAEEAFRVFEEELKTLATASDDHVFAAVERVAVALNTIDAECGVGFDTLDREDLCDYIDASLSGAGIDVDALAARRGIGRAEITDEWRDW
ncbi:hypothetical protein HS041_20750 [Planomonospora sp. ID67723]|uniref:hypothetical protein n=1 Tax=Planomonospora sp. ID67723 TaxID=2738134 RepID=UPI0018C3614A|nr:hypothetical protein [Planomonospora sp. ID67723]MBG0830197.1 hypothetical protein [Planomonospora sp. ID67723]